LLQARALDPTLRRKVGTGKAFGDVLQDRAVLGEQVALVGAQGRHHAERVDLVEVGAVRQALVAVALDILGVGAGLVECDAGRHRAGEW